MKDYVDDSLVEKVWHDLDGQVSRQQIARAVTQTSDGDQVLTFAPAKEYQTLVFSSSELEEGSTYHVYLDGSAAGEASDGLYQDGSYTPGNEYTRFTVSGVVTWIGSLRR